MPYPADILILSNGPGEVTTWVRPVVRSLRSMLGNDRTLYRISLVLSPCSNASGHEVDIARRFPEIDRIQGAQYFFSFLLFGKTIDQWDWRKHGIVVFLGGDQIYPILIGKRLGFQTVIYGEWDTRWHRWGDHYGVMNESLIQGISKNYIHKFTVVGDLMASATEPSPLHQGDTDISGFQPNPTHSPPTIGFLPGSKAIKLTQGVPFALAIAHYIHQKNPHVRFVIPVAPTLDLDTLGRFANAETNPVITQMGGISAQLFPAIDDSCATLKINEELFIELHTEFPAYDLLRRCQLCITTVGANTAELGALAVPMLVLILTQKLEAMKAWDGVPGLIANMPGIGNGFARLFNRWFLRKNRLLAWPNIWAGAEIVPELIGELQPQDIGDRILDFLNHPEKLTAMSDRLRQVRGKPGAADRLAQIVIDELKSKKQN